MNTNTTTAKVQYKHGVLSATTGLVEEFSSKAAATRSVVAGQSTLVRRPVESTTWYTVASSMTAAEWFAVFGK